MLLIVLSQEIGYEVLLCTIDGGHANLVIVEIDLGKCGNGIHFFSQGVTGSQGAIGMMAEDARRPVPQSKLGTPSHPLNSWVDSVMRG